jgi:Na+-transporting NADH:ubiquinone oxidoreductase subunit F
MDFTTPLILFGSLIVVTLLIIIFDMIFASKGARKIVINESTVIPVSGDDTLLTILAQNQIFIPSACGGKATCGFCKCTVTEGGGEIKSTEKSFIKPEDAARGVRLS